MTSNSCTKNNNKGISYYPILYLLNVNKATKSIYCIADNGESHQIVTTPITASNRVSATLTPLVRPQMNRLTTTTKKERVRLNVAYPGLSAWLAAPTDLSFITVGTTSKLYDGYDPTKEDEEEPEPPVVYEDLAISQSSLALYFDKEEESVAEVEILSGNGSYSVESDNEDVAIAALEENVITVTAIAVGTAIITVTDTESGQTQTIEVEVSKFYDTPEGLEAVDLGLPSGTKWANMNVGANAPEEFGGYYAWGETEEKDWYDENTYAYYQNDANVNIGNDIAGTEYDVAHVKWGGDWQMPTSDQINELLDNTTSAWTTQDGVKGRLFTSNINGNSIFLPAAGYRIDGTFSQGNGYGSYRSSTQYSWKSGDVFILVFQRSAAYQPNYGIRYHGNSVRPVSK